MLKMCADVCSQLHKRHTALNGQMTMTKCTVTRVGHGKNPQCILPETQHEALDRGQ